MKPTKRTITAVVFGVGLSLGAAGLVNAAASTDSSTATTVAPSDTSTAGTTDTTGTDTAGTADTTGTSDAPDTADAPDGPHTANGITETELTGTDASSVEAAVLAANPGATIERMETDAEGAAFEAHVTLADGSEATVKLDSSFAVTATEQGHGGGGGHGGHGGGPHGANGATETELTGTEASSVEAAVLAANPGATIERMETDAEGAAYEAHVTLADGSEATVKLDSSFVVTATEAKD